ncbi:MAG: 4Fe-4S dicluster domain-containing protein [Desulfobulbaceae bacterium]|nr:4Fe-4S dicluster domain-containing protein [Desulfobulbaceae bacterium]
MTERRSKPRNPSSSAGKKPVLDVKKKKFYEVSFFYAWCKACGICAAFCPKKIIKTDKEGIPKIDEHDRCTGCRFCEKHCPDFAVTVKERGPRRRKTDD